VLATGVAKLARYNTHGPEDLLFGLGSGCEGTMDILLQRLDGSNDWQPLKRLALAWRAQRAQTLAHTMHEGFDFGGHAFEYRDIEA
jgi:hypothetical protein